MPQKWPEWIKDEPIIDGATGKPATRRGRGAIKRTFRMPDGTEQVFDPMWEAPPHASIVFPVTHEREIIAVEQYRYGAKKPLIEIPGGNPKPGQTPEGVAAAELEQETGFRPGSLVRLPVAESWWEPATYDAWFHAFLALDCTPTETQKLDRSEHLKVMKIPLREWIRMIQERGEVEDQKTIAITFLALPYLGIELKFS